MSTLYMVEFSDDEAVLLLPSREAADAANADAFAGEGTVREVTASEAEAEGFVLGDMS